MLEHLKTAVPHIETGLSEIKNGSSKTAEIILQALNEVLKWINNLKLNLQQ